MHDPMVVVFEVRGPIPQRTQALFKNEPRWRFRGCFWNIAGRRFYWPALITVWHNEPKGRDSGTVCKGMRGSGLSLHNVLWAIRHVRHLSIHVEPYRKVKRWLLDRCDECGYRFFWKQARFSYMSTDKVWHDKCMALRHVQGQLDDLTQCVKFTADDTTRWRAEYRLTHLDEKAAANG